MCKKEKVTYLRCSLPKCDNPLTGKQRKFCSRKCLIKANCIARKGIYKDLDGWAGGPRGIGTVESSIKKDESYVIGDGRFSVDDYPVDPDIFAIAEANHEKYILDRNEYEARVVIDGLTIFQEEYNKHHDVTYQMEQAKKREAKLTEDQKKSRSIRNTIYQIKNKEKINARQRAKHKANPEKRRAYARKYYKENIKKPELFQVEQWLKKRISGS
mgnify:FL=1